jgi:hypothetical protein
MHQRREQPRITRWHSTTFTFGTGGTRAAFRSRAFVRTAKAGRAATVLVAPPRSEARPSEPLYNESRRTQGDSQAGARRYRDFGYADATTDDGFLRLHLGPGSSQR